MYFYYTTNYEIMNLHAIVIFLNAILYVSMSIIS